MTPAQRQLADEITLSELREDPCPTCRGLRDEAPVAWVPAVGPDIAHVWSLHGPQAVTTCSAIRTCGPAVDLGLAAAPLPGHRLAVQAA